MGLWEERRWDSRRRDWRARSFFRWDASVGSSASGSFLGTRDLVVVLLGRAERVGGFEDWRVLGSVC